MASCLKNLNVVLVRAENPVNIGQSARAMKNFGVHHLNLIRCRELNEEAYTNGWKAREILKKARHFSKVSELLKPSHYSVGFTARFGKYRRMASFPTLIPEILESLQCRKVFFVFGNEKNGLSNEELSQCQKVVTLPTHKSYLALNLSHAVAVSLGMIYCKLEGLKNPLEKPESFYPKQGEFDQFLRSLKTTLDLLGYNTSKKILMGERIFEDFKIFFQRAGLDRKELHLFQSLFSRINQKIK